MHPDDGFAKSWSKQYEMSLQEIVDSLRSDHPDHKAVVDYDKLLARLNSISESPDIVSEFSRYISELITREVDRQVREIISIDTQKVIDDLVAENRRLSSKISALSRGGD